MKRHRQPRRSRGMSLVELLALLPIMAAVSLLMTEMAFTCLKMTWEARDRDTAIFRMDTALAALRRDAWRAQSIEAKGDQVAFVEPDGVILWRMEAPGKLMRIVPANLPAQSTWSKMPAFSFRSAGPLLMVDVESKPGAAEQTTFVSQRMLAGGGK